MQARSLAETLFQSATYPQGLTAQSAWLGMYQVLLWYEPVNIGTVVGLPHIIDANYLRPVPGRPPSSSLNTWGRRASAVESHLAQQLGVERTEVPPHVDLLMRHPTYAGRQRQNPLGAAFPALVKHVLEQFGNTSVQYRLEVLAGEIFPGISVPGRSATPQMDILVERQGHFRAIISAKWSLRHDRLNDISNECPVYKAAAQWTRSHLDYLVITNEFASARLQKLLKDTCVDGVVHVHKPLVTTVCGMNGAVTSLLDLTELIARSHTW